MIYPPKNNKATVEIECPTCKKCIKNIERSKSSLSSFQVKDTHKNFIFYCCENKFEIDAYKSTTITENNFQISPQNNTIRIKKPGNYSFAFEENIKYNFRLYYQLSNRFEVLEKELGLDGKEPNLKACSAIQLFLVIVIFILGFFHMVVHISAKAPIHKGDPELYQYKPYVNDQLKQFHSNHFPITEIESANQALAEQKVIIYELTNKIETLTTQYDKLKMERFDRYENTLYKFFWEFFMPGAFIVYVVRKFLKAVPN